MWVSDYFDQDAGPPPGFVNVGQASSPTLPVLPGADRSRQQLGRRPSRHAVAATIAVLIFPFTGVLALAAAFSVDDRFYSGDLRGARTRSRWALVWSLLSWVCATLLIVGSVVFAWVLLAPWVSQVSSQVSSTVSSMEDLSGSSSGLSGLLGPGLLPDDSGALPPGQVSPLVGQRQEELAARFTPLVALWESESGLSAWALWGEVQASGTVPGVGRVLPFGVVGVELVDAKRHVLVSVLQESSVCSVLLDASRDRAQVLEVTC